MVVTAITDDPDNPIGTETVLAAPRTGTAPTSTPWKPYNLIWSPDGAYLLAFAWGSVEGAVIAVPVDPARSPVVIDDDLGAAIGTDDLDVYDGTPWIPLQAWSEP